MTQTTPASQDIVSRTLKAAGVPADMIPSHYALQDADAFVTAPRHVLVSVSRALLAAGYGSFLISDDGTTIRIPAQRVKP